VGEGERGGGGGGGGVGGGGGGEGGAAGSRPRLGVAAEERAETRAGPAGGGERLVLERDLDQARERRRRAAEGGACPRRGEPHSRARITERRLDGLPPRRRPEPTQRVDRGRANLLGRIAGGRDEERHGLG